MIDKIKKGLGKPAGWMYFILVVALLIIVSNNSKEKTNLQAEIAQSNINKRLFAHEQEARTQYIPEVDIMGAFATQAIEFGGDYMEWKGRKDEKEAEEKRMSNMMVRIGVL